MLRQRAEHVLQRLEATCRADRFKGWDPYDGLNSRLFAITPLRRWPLARLAWQQLFKRAPVNLRPLAAVPKIANAATAALAARAYDLMGRPQERRHQVEALLALRSDAGQWGEGAWGYPFDWQARAFYVAAGVPNIICTAFAVRSLMETGAELGQERNQIICAAARFTYDHLRRSAADGGTYIGYVPDSAAMVHNASLWGAYVLAQGGVLATEPRWLDAARMAAEYSVRAQRTDGAWVYGEAGHHQFIDSFHTGYNLEALALCRSLLGTADFDAAIAKGMSYYAATFFEPDGAAKYYANRTYPIDCNPIAQAVITLLTVDRTPARASQADAVLRWALEHMWIEETGSFAYQKFPGRTDRIKYMRWSQIWMLLALSLWVKEREQS